MIVRGIGGTRKPVPSRLAATSCLGVSVRGSTMETKQCRKCGAYKPYDQFSKDKTSKDGRCSKCKECHKTYARAHFQRNKQAYAAYSKSWDAANPDKRKAMNQPWRDRNPEKHEAAKRTYRENNPGANSSPEYLAQWRENNKARIAVYDRQRRDKTKQATPKWANLVVMEWIYRGAIEYSKVTGVPHQVDHIIPLKSPLVCGLHVESNLRIIPATENLKKGNRHWPDMPE